MLVNGVQLFARDHSRLLGSLPGSFSSNDDATHNLNLRLSALDHGLVHTRAQWLLVSVGDRACDAECERHLYLQRQLREGLGKEKGRLDWVWLRTGSTPLTPALLAATEQATVLQVDEAALAQWLQPAPGQRLSDHLYVVDPLGNWMMRFPAPLDPKKAKSDLDRLLRASAFWDKAGRP